jgi:pimeloyl-ACP methyl ester carboxylesterase
MPGSRFGPRPSTRDLHLYGIRLIAYDRPGYAGSDRLEGRSVSHAAADVAAIARELGIERLSVMGRSGGAPHAMACGALLPELVENVAALVSLAPPDADGLDWYEGMAPSNVHAFQLGSDPALLHQELMKRRAAISGEPVEMIRSLVNELSPEERRIIRESGVHRMFVENFHAVFAGGQGEEDDAAEEQGSLGWFDDCLSLTKPWGFDVAAIEVPVLLWHGENDHFSPLQHFHWLSERIPYVTPVVALDTAHLSAVRVMPRILRWLADPAHRAIPAGRPDQASVTRR